MQDVQVYLINLDRSPDRLKTASALLAGAGVSFERLPAVDGKTLDLAGLAQYDAETAARTVGHALLPGEVGCYLSHLESLERFLATDARYSLVLEDDFNVDAGGFATLAAVLDWARDGDDAWHVANLSRPAKKFWRAARVLDVAPETVLQRAYYLPITTTALLWTREGAGAFLEGCRQITMPVDLALQHHTSRSGLGLACRPPPFPPHAVESDIGDAARRDNFQRRKDYHLRRLIRRWSNYGPSLRHYLKGAAP